MKHRRPLLAACLFLAVSGVSCAGPAESKSTPPASAEEKARQAVMAQLKTVDYGCTFDNSKQKARCHFAKGDAPRPLLVALHSWSYGYTGDSFHFARFCIRNNWNFIFPHYRGPNWTPQACGSDAVVADIADAVAYMKRVSKVDDDRVYLIGGSGGGHAALLMAARRPELWTAVSVWCPISDIAAYHDQCIERKRGYFEHIRKVCGGDPAKDPAAKAEAVRRSPLTWIGGASRVLLDINAGIHDGHDFGGRRGPVPVSQSLDAFNALAAPEDRISPADASLIVKEQKIPKNFSVPEKDPSFGTYPVIFRRESNLVRITIFEGGHDCLPDMGMLWLARQNRKSPPDWSPGRGSRTEAVEITK
ncbi:MAG: prolyl oligopeptidase family serine peptidase [Lentisphaeria bacterium]|nr:prolyl oligopeptidase family serine peptidase [Lentisphaeria bacterium]